ncbi:MAG: YsnF/AvaK domain-containing protein [Pyrinomonadaceae bacterium]
MNDYQKPAFQVVDERGLRGTIDLTALPESGSDSRLVLVRFDDGSQVFADARKFVEREEGVFYFPDSFERLIAENPNAAYGLPETSERIVIPVLAEQLKIARQKVLTGGVRVHKTVEQRTETVNEPVLQEQVNVERVTVNQYVESPPPVRYEGETMIVPVLEEVLVVEKRLVLREEIRITKTRAAVNQSQDIVLRREQVTLEKIKPEADAKKSVEGNQS